MVIKFSPRFAILLLLLHMVVAIVVCATAISLAIRLAMILLIFMSLFYYLARDVFILLPDSWCEISLNQDHVAIITRDGSMLLGQVASKTIVSSYFAVLHVRFEGHRLLISRVIFPDAMSTEAFRELCVRLKFA